MAHRRQANVDLSEAEKMISQREVDRYIRLTTNFIKQLKRIKSVKQRKAVASTAVMDIILAVTNNAVEAVGLLEFTKRELMMALENEYLVKVRLSRPSPAIV